VVPHTNRKLLANSDFRISDHCVNSSFDMDLSIFDYCLNFFSVVKMLLAWDSFVVVCRFFNCIDVFNVNLLEVDKEILLNVASISFCSRLVACFLLLFLLLFLRLLLFFLFRKKDDEFVLVVMRKFGSNVLEDLLCV